MRRSKGKLNFTVSPWRTTSLCPAQLHFCVSKNFTKQKKRANGLKTVNSLYYLSQVSHLFYKCTGLCPYPYLISPLRTSPIGLRSFFVIRVFDGFFDAVLLLKCLKQGVFLEQSTVGGFIVAKRARKAFAVGQDVQREDGITVACLHFLGKLLKQGCRAAVIAC